jgi:hypothetical protein
MVSRRVTRRLAPGTGTASKQLLQVAVVLLGNQLSLIQVARTGLSSPPVMLGTLAACLISAARRSLASARPPRRARPHRRNRRAAQPGSPAICGG